MTTSNSIAQPLDILIVVWREIDAVKTLFDILESQSFQNYRVLVALNDPDDTVTASMPSNSKWEYHSGANEGYAGGLQRLLPHVKSDWVLCSNTDLTFKANFLDDFVKATQSVGEHIGYLGPKILFEDGRLQSAGGLLLGPEGLCKLRGIGEKNNTCLDHLSEVPVLSGCCFMIRKKVLDDVGGFDPRFFMYMEDIDYSRRIHMRYNTVYYPDVQVFHMYHKGSYKRINHLKYHISSAIKYFNKWGWFFDKERKKINQAEHERF